MHFFALGAAVSIFVLFGINVWTVPAALIMMTIYMTDYDELRKDLRKRRRR